MYKSGTTMEKTLKMTKALADKNRLRVVMFLIAQEELCVCQITEMLELATATVSRHMSLLQSVHLVKSRKEGRWMYYSLSNTFPPLLMHWIKDELLLSEENIKDIEKLQKILLCNPEDLSCIKKTHNKKKNCYRHVTDETSSS